MRVEKRRIQQGQGEVTLTPEHEEDLWYLYNLILTGDIVKCMSYRKVQKSNGYSTTSEKKLIRVTLGITKIEYFQDECISMIIKGKQLIHNDYINKGQFHSIDIPVGYKVTLAKSSWTKYDLELLKECSDVVQQSDVCAMVMEEGVAHICYISSNTTLIKHKIEKNIQKKSNNNTQYDKQLEQFYDQCSNIIINHVNFDKIKCFIIASPGFVKDQMFKNLKTNIVKSGMGPSIPLSKLILVHSSNGYKDALMDTYNNPTVQSLLKDTKAQTQVSMLDKFYKQMSSDNDRVAYGSKFVLEANENQAISELLISDKLFRHKNFDQRKLYIGLVEKVKYQAGKVVVFSSMHTSGQQLNNLGGLAALLRYPLNMDYLEDDSSVDLSSNNTSVEFQNNFIDTLEVDQYDL